MQLWRDDTCVTRTVHVVVIFNVSERIYASHFGHAYRGLSLYLEIVRIVAAGLHKSSILKSDIPWICLYARSYTTGILFNSVL